MRRPPARLRRLVIRRSGDRCEYCHLSQAGQEASFHIDHVTPVIVGGETVVENFRWREVSLIGITSTGRVTIRALDLNRPLILAIRREEAALGRHP